MVASLTATVLRLLLEEIAVEAGGIDVFRLFNQPERWGGIANPVLALSRRQGPNNLYFAAIAGAPLPFADHRLPPRHRGNIRRGARRLTESLGPLTLRRADTVAELERQHAAFLAQRARRFAVMGIDNIFGETEFVAYFRRLALEGRGRPRPALAFHALYAGEEIVATSIGTFQGGHYSQYINSTASTGPAARTSLIGILMDRLADELVAGGIASIDMGTGDFPYKTDWTAPQPLYHSTVPITRRGALALPALEAASALKRTIKQDQRLWTIAQRTRRLIYRARHWREKE
jgi:CelD/BcsL family acetyltransferase involved in cellulose biosynthesis